ncbi:hypothetical protein HYR99_02550 [Candidatus Poribacteria bacterium]|nr:hypothetical protein [Candidatus Poribacteria bacterium]
MDGPVHIPTGYLHHSETDLAIPGRGLGVEFTRYYASYYVSDPTENGTP